jgi:hypothetical protein
MFWYRHYPHTCGLWSRISILPPQPTARFKLPNVTTTAAGITNNRAACFLRTFQTEEIPIKDISSDV